MCVRAEGGGEGTCEDCEGYPGAMSRRLETSNEDSYLSAGKPSNLLRTKFSSAKLESLYRETSLQQRRGGLECFLITALFYGAYAIVSPGQKLVASSVTVVFLALNLALLAWAKYNTRSRFWCLVTYLAWYLFLVQLLAQLYLKSAQVTPRDGLGWMLILLYLSSALPFNLAQCVRLAFCTALGYIIVNVKLSDARFLIPIDVLVRFAQVFHCFSFRRGGYRLLHEMIDRVFRGF